MQHSSQCMWAWLPDRSGKDREGGTVTVGGEISDGGYLGVLDDEEQLVADP